MKILPGNAINRQYRNAKQFRNRSLALLTMSTTAAAMTAKNRHLFPTLMLSSIIFLFGKGLEASINKMIDLKDDYKNILNRLKQVQKLKK